MTQRTRSRALGAMYGLAIGDALGMPTQMLPRPAVLRLFPALEGFLPGPEENGISRGQAAGRVTDDTEQALLLADELLRGRGEVDPRAFVERLLLWAQDAEKDGSEQLGPSSRRAMEAVMRGGSPEESGRHGVTNGAAMRVAPVGVATPPEPLDRLVDRVVAASKATHFTGLAIAGAAAVAAAVSVGVAGGGAAQALATALAAARRGQALGHYAAGPDIAWRIECAVDLVRDLDWPQAADVLDRLVGTGVTTQEAVPAAFAVAALSPGDPWTACLRAASLGGDSDTVAAMVGAIVGAQHGLDAFPPEARRTVQQVNALDLEGVTDRLLALRRS